MGDAADLPIAVPPVPPTDAQLRDAALAELRLTTVGYLNHKWPPPPPAGTHWATALELLARIGVAAQPPGTVIPAPAPPIGPFETFSTQQMYRDTAHPTTLAKIAVTTGDPYAFFLMGGGFPPGPPPSPSPFTVQDIIGISTAPFNPAGTDGFGVWLGTQCNADRIHGEGPNGGIWTGEHFTDSTLTNFVAKTNGVGVGLYCEHDNWRSLYKLGEVQGSQSSSIQVEWDPKVGQGPNRDLTFDTLKVYCPATPDIYVGGIALGPGTYGCVGRNLYFWGPGPAWIQPLNIEGAPDNLLDEASCTFANGGARVVHDPRPA
jgi:hypothetical protein